MKRINHLKKAVLFVFLISISAFVSAERWSRGGAFGIKGGINFPSVVFSSDVYDYLENTVFFTPTGSFYFEYNIAAGLTIRPEFAYTQRGSFVRTSDYTWQLTQQMAEFRFALMYFFAHRSNFQPYIFGAPYGSYIFKSTYEKTWEDNSEKERVVVKKNDVKNFSPIYDYGILVGLGFRGILNTQRDNDYYISVEGSYCFSLLNNFPSKGSSSDASVVEPTPFPNQSLAAEKDMSYGTRKNRGYEIAISLGFPFSNFKKSSTSEYSSEEEEEEELEEQSEQEETTPEEEASEESSTASDDGKIDTTYITSTTLRDIARIKQRQQQTEEAEEAEEDFSEEQVASRRTEHNTTPSMKREVDKVDNITVELLPSMNNGNLTLKFVYYVRNPKINLYAPGDDYAPGAYLYGSSKGCTEMIYYIKEKLEYDYAQYFTGENKIKVSVYGTADATPVKSTLVYRGEFDQVRGAIRQDGRIVRLQLEPGMSVKNNQELAYLRTTSVTEALKEKINYFSTDDENISFQRKIVTKPGRRSVSVEIVIEGALIEDEGW